MSAPDISWDAMLKMIKFKFDLSSDLDMHMFFEKGARGRISYISNRYSEANKKSYDPKQESKHFIYLDENSLYGYAMSTFLPTSGFKYIDPKKFDLNKYTSNTSKGCFLEVDLECPKELRELHNDYPLAPNKIEIKREMQSEYQLKITNLCNITIGNIKKLMPKYFDKEKYVFHYENLQLYLRLELKLKKIHCVLEFNQLQWLKPLNTEFNSQKRMKVEKNNDKNGKALYKLINNAIYGKRWKT